MLLCSSGRLVGCGGKAERTCDLPEHEQGMVFCQVVAAASCRAVSLGWLSVGVWKEELRLRPGRAPERSCAGTARRSHVAAAVQRARAALHGSCTGLGSHSFDRWGLALSSKLPWIRRGARKLHPQALVVNDKSGHPHSGVQRGHPIMHARFLPYPPPQRGSQQCPRWGAVHPEEEDLQQEAEAAAGSSPTCEPASRVDCVGRDGDEAWLQAVGWIVEHRFKGMRRCEASAVLVALSVLIPSSSHLRARP